MSENTSRTALPGYEMGALLNDEYRLMGGTHLVNVGSYVWMYGCMIVITDGYEISLIVPSIAVIETAIIIRNHPYPWH